MGSHLVQPEEPWVENVPAMQSEHAFTDADPSVGTYVPPAQAVLSLEPPAHQNPAGHSAPSADKVAGGQYLPAATVQSCLSCAGPRQKYPTPHVKNRARILHSSGTCPVSRWCIVPATHSRTRLDNYRLYTHRNLHRYLLMLHHNQCDRTQTDTLEQPRMAHTLL
jgi:hypothetical protein